MTFNTTCSQPGHCQTKLNRRANSNCRQNGLGVLWQPGPDTAGLEAQRAGAESGARFPTRTDLCPGTRSREDHRRPRKDLLTWIPGQRVRHDHSIPSGSRSPDSLFCYSLH
ncbi:unnamed protein product [Arctogadus glacialis]